VEGGGARDHGQGRRRRRAAEEAAAAAAAGGLQLRLPELRAQLRPGRRRVAAAAAASACWELAAGGGPAFGRLTLRAVRIGA